MISTRYRSPILATDAWRTTDGCVFSLVDPGAVFSRSGTAFREYPIGSIQRLEEVTADVARCSWKTDANARAIRGFFLEPASTNHVLYSCTFDDTSWTKRGGSIVDTKFTLPTGDESLYDVFHENSGNGFHDFYRLNYIYNPWTVTLSAFVQPINRDQIMLSFGASNGKFDLTTGVVDSTDCLYGSIESFGDYSRIQCTINHPGGWGYLNLFLLDDWEMTFQGLDQDSLVAWCIQAEYGTHASSPIITEGSSVSRTTDSDWTAEAPLPDARQGWLSGKLRLPFHTPASDLPILSLSDSGSAADRIRLQVNTSGQLEVVSACTGGSAGQATTDAIVSNATCAHWHLTWKPDKLMLVVDNTHIACDMDVSIPVGLDQLALHAHGGIMGDLQMGDRFQIHPSRFVVY